MVASISVVSGPVASIADYFAHENAEEIGGYYVAERPGQWFGQGTRRLGLSGVVSGVDFELVLAGHDQAGKPLIPLRAVSKVKEQSNEDESASHPGNELPDTERDKRQQPKERRHRVAGYDVCCSVPKSLSVLWVVSSDKVRRVIEQCLMEAVRKMVCDIEAFLPLARRGKGGKRQMSAELVASMFLHTLSRAGDPQLHCHAVLNNLCHGKDGRWSSIDSSMLHHWTPCLGRVFRCHLATELTQQLGLELEMRVNEQGQQDSWFEISGVLQELNDEFSTRRKEIEVAVGKDNLGDSKARQDASLKTRQRKDQLPDMAALARSWKEKTEQYGFNRYSVEHLMWRAQREPITPSEINHAFNVAIERSAEGRAHFSESLIIQNVCEILQHRGVDPSKLIPQVREMMEQTNQLVTLSDTIGKQRFSTREYWEVETRMLGHVDTLVSRTGAVVPEKKVDEILQSGDQRHGSKLSDEQKAAVRNLLTDDKAIRSMDGVAGSGKTLVMDAVRRGFMDQGYRVIGGAISGKATAGLQESANVESRTVASYLFHAEKRTSQRLKEGGKHHARMLVRQLAGRKTHKQQRIGITQQCVLFIDEASMIDTRTMTRLLHHATKAKATIILVGDPSQLPAIDAGGPAAYIAERIGAANLETNRRQRHESDRDAVKQVRSGNMIEALENYAERDRLTITNSPSEMTQKVVETWVSQGGLQKPENHMVVTQTRAQAAKVNQACQQRRLAEKTSLPGYSVSLGDTRFFANDRVMFHKAIRTIGVENGFTGTIELVDPVRGRLTVKLDQVPSGNSRANKTHQSVSVPLRSLRGSDVTLAYAATTHKLQGATVDYAYVLLTGKMISKEMVYTQLTRAREGTHLFVDKKSAGKDFETLTASMKRSVKKDLAHDINPNAKTRSTSLKSDPHDFRTLNRVTKQDRNTVSGTVSRQSSPKVKPVVRQRAGEKTRDTREKNISIDLDSNPAQQARDVVKRPARGKRTDVVPQSTENIDSIARREKNEPTNKPVQQSEPRIER